MPAYARIFVAAIEAGVAPTLLSVSRDFLSESSPRLQKGSL